jgi:hypothetical protein
MISRAYPPDFPGTLARSLAESTVLDDFYAGSRDIMRFHLRFSQCKSISNLDKFAICTWCLKQNSVISCGFNSTTVKRLKGTKNPKMHEKIRNYVVLRKIVFKTMESGGRKTAARLAQLYRGSWGTCLFYKQRANSLLQGINIEHCFRTVCVDKEKR